MADREAAYRQQRRMRRMYLHLIAFSAGVVGLFVSDYFTPGRPWFHWPAMAWGAVMLAHYLYCKSMQVAHDEAWADERSRDLRMKSYDLGHIRAILRSPKKYGEPDSRHEPRDATDSR
jgi:hypothetical protein